jgi:DNA primase
MSALSPALAARKAEVLRRASLEAVVRRRVPKLIRAGREWQALCPFHAESTPSFTVAPEKGFTHCFGCGHHGDVIGFVMAFDGVDFMGALAVLEGELGIDGAAPVTDQAHPRPLSQAGGEKRESDFVSSTVAGQAVWAASVNARGTLVETYLRSRGIDPAATGILTVLGFLPRCPTGLWRPEHGLGSARNFAPAMLAPICRVEGEPGSRRLVQQGVHITYLAPDGSGKAVFPALRGKVPPSRKIWGELSGGAVPIPPRRLAGEPLDRWIDFDRALVVGEGLESTLSLMALNPDHRGGFATLALNNLQGFPLERRVGRDHAWPLYAMQPDPARAMFTFGWPGRVLIGVDADMKGLTNRRVQEAPRGPVLQRDLTGAERSDICAALACAAWRNAGASMVWAVRPAMGRDFND